ncbi:hypothetical protein MIND_00432300 [Mycena indigotica]|uniref:Uncharacterized protein n=1 Tax=Mycena indigotica TaxID=2126181 RepID=A0A8H6SVV5_9AGAR|nr:uncharacterized protein MIND_00432300 [Mycena indigotica]KAF7306411.1 hypothetical protein MIND_00432300 [Mycena indigotica]
MRSLWPAIVLSFILPALASITIIDDEKGDPTNGNKISYEPAGAWQSGTIAGCPQPCRYPPPSLMNQGTYTGSVYNPKEDFYSPYNATVNFTGVSVSVKCVLSDSMSQPKGRTELYFYVDNAFNNSFIRDPSGSNQFLPNHTVFTVGGLVPGPHTLRIQNGAINGQVSLAILDSIWYSADEDLSRVTTGAIVAATTTRTNTSSSPTSSHATVIGATKSSSSKTAAIVGGVVAVLAVFLLGLLAFLYLRQRRKQQQKSNVPLSTTLFSPFRDLLSAARRSARPQQDMAPVPFPTPIQAEFPTTRPRPRPHTTPASGSRSRLSRISFNPNLLVARMRRAPPAPAPVGSPIPSGDPLMRQASLPPENIASIQAWQRQTLQATAGEPPLHPLDISEVDLSSHYDESSSGPPPPQPVVPRSPQPQRRFTVMNN